MDADLLTSNRALLDRFRRGDKEALVLVWQHYYPLVHSMARRGFGPYRGFQSHADIEDAISATFLAAFEENCRVRYDGVTPFGSFLLGIGRNTMRRQMLKAAREPVHDPHTRKEEQTSDPDPEAQFLSMEQSRVLAAFLATLTEDERAAFGGYYKDGFSEEKLAVVMGRTRYRVRKTLHKVERKLKKYLKHHGLER